MANQPKIDIAPQYYEAILEILNMYLPNRLVWAYGSRVKFSASKYSDLDLVAFEATDLQIRDAIEAFEESILPYRVSLMSWETLPKEFQNNINECYVEITSAHINQFYDNQK